LDVVAIDISGRHSVEGTYLMVCASVAVRISPEGIEATHGVKLVPQESTSLDLEVIVELIQKATEGFSGMVVAERGDFYNLERWRAKSILGRDLKYPESLGERKSIELAHHISFAGRNMLLNLGADLRPNILPNLLANLQDEDENTEEDG